MAAMLFAYAVCFSFAYRDLTAATGALLLFGAVQLTMTGYGLFAGERLKGLRLVGVLIAIAGLVWLLLPGLSAPPVIAAGLMLAAGLDRNALRWGPLVPEGSLGWAMLTVAQPTRSGPVGGGAIDRFIGDDGSAGQRKSRFLVAGLAGLGRLDQGDIASASGDLGINLARENAWSRKIGRAAELGNPALVALLAGVGMQGEGWDKMTALHLFHIVRALDRVGLGAEARMIAAEAVARG
ncbi:MAG: hypothetical protein B7Z07_02040 [Sphingomonadales bacterium 32-67-7]|nr:MAG: hypothetical protein B7Z07_02040 [Sphingomonadales bacterium 32-67-7]